jgi:hypothetical protein
MSREPVLNTILPPLSKTNEIIPLNLRSKSIVSFPPMATPKLQPLNKDRISFPGLKGITLIPPTKMVVEEKVKKTKKLNITSTPYIKSLSTVGKKKPKRKSLVYFILLFMTSLFLVAIINTILIRLFVNQ